jgi:penicillin-binding protein 1A
MEKENMITEAQKLELQSLPIALSFKLESHREGTATYFREYLRDYMKKWVDDKKTRWLRLRHIQRRTENLHNDRL